MRDEALLVEIEELDDFQAVRRLEHFANELFAGMETSRDDVLAGVPDSVRQSETLRWFEALPARERDAKLSPERSGATARELLRLFAGDPSLAPALRESMASYRDDRMMALEILALGTAVSMVIVAATSSLRGRIGSFEVVKTNASPKQLEKIVSIGQGLIGSK